MALLTYAAAAAALALSPVVARRLTLSAAKDMSLAGHVRLAKRVSKWLPAYDLEDDVFYAADGASQAIADRRKAGFLALAHRLESRSPLSLAATAEAASSISDMQLIGRNRAPFPYRKQVQKHLKVGSFWQSAQGVHITDLDGNRFIDLTGSYGVNLLGADFYQQNMRDTFAAAAQLGATLGAYQPEMLEVLSTLRRISGLDQVSFHMSGTEAVMQAVRLARYHTGKRYLVRFAGAYNGWWEDTQPGPGNPLPPGYTLTLKDMHATTLRVLRQRRDIACVIVNPVQAMHPNRMAPGDSTMVGGTRDTHFDREAYTQWLKQLRDVCTERGIVLIMDEVFVGFRVAKGGAQAYFGVQADLVTYGKTLGGGYPVGVVCGKRALMQRFKEGKPGDICFARGTFNAHPHVISAMHGFLKHIETPEAEATYATLDNTWQQRAERFNAAMQAAGLPVRTNSMSTIWSINYLQSSRFNWLYQFYLRDAGLALSWIGTGRLIFTLNFTEADMDGVIQRFISAGEKMLADGWWWPTNGTEANSEAPTAREIRRQLLREIISSKLAFFAKPAASSSAA